MNLTGISIRVEESGPKNKAPKWSLLNDLNGEATTQQLFEYTKASLITISDIVLKEEQNDGFDFKPVLVVDKQFGKSKYDVHPLGKIEYYSRQDLKQIITDTYEAILQRSPVGEGEYIGNNVVTYNGTQIANNATSLKNFLSNRLFNDKDIFRFVNTSPYARKLERYGTTRNSDGKGKGKFKLSYEASRRKVKRKGASASDLVRVPSGVYALAYKFLQRKYSRNSFMRFRLLQGNELGLTSDSNDDTKQYRKYRKGHGAGRFYFYPTIIISAVAAGLKDGIEP